MSRTLSTAFASHTCSWPAFRGGLFGRPVRLLPRHESHRISPCFCDTIQFGEVGGVRESEMSVIMRRSVDPRNVEVVDDQLAQVLRRKSPAEKVEMVVAANRTARLLAAAGIRYQHPEWNDAQIQAEVIRRVTSGTK